MTNSEGMLRNAEIALDKLAELYPLAFALASASGFRPDRAVSRRQSVQLLDLAGPAGQPESLPPAEGAAKPAR